MRSSGPHGRTCCTSRTTGGSVGGTATASGQRTGVEADFNGEVHTIDTVVSDATDGFIGYRNSSSGDHQYGGFDDRPEWIRTGRNSGYQSIHVAAHLGAKRIYLLGFDMRPGQWCKYAVPTNDDFYDRCLPLFDELKPHLEVRGIQVVNCTPGSRLKTWPSSRIQDQL